MESPKDTDRQRLLLLANTLRLSAHTLERSPDQLYNQLHGRLGPLPYLRHMDLPPSPYLQLKSRTLRAPNRALVSLLIGHTDRVVCCAFSPNGRLLVTGGADKTLRLWDVLTGNCLQVFTGHSAEVTACAFHPQRDTVFLSASEDATLRLWDIDSPEASRVFRGHRGPINACAFSPTGDFFVSASGPDEMRQDRIDTDNSLRLWDTNTGQCLAILTESLGSEERLKDRESACAVSPDGQFVLSGNADNKLRLWDVKRNACVTTLWDHGDTVLSCAFSADGLYALSASADRTLRLWRLLKDENGWNVHAIRTLVAHADSVTGCAMSAGGRYAISSSHDTTLRLWDLASGQCLATLSQHTGWVNGCALDSTHMFAASVSSDTTAAIWDVGAILSEPSISDGDDVPLRESWQSERVFTGHSASAHGCAFSPDGERVLSTGDGWFDLRLWDRATGDIVNTFTHEGWMRCLAYHPTQACVLGGYDDRREGEQTLVLWDIPTGRRIRTYSGHEWIISQCVFSSDGRRILSASIDNTVRLWDVETGECLRTFTGHTEGVLTCAISPDGTLGLSGGHDWTMRLWDLQTGECLHIYKKEHGGRSHGVMRYRGLLNVNSCAFSPDGIVVASGSDDETVSLWSVESGDLVRVCYGHTKAVTSVAFSPDGRFLVSASDDQSVRLWDAATTACLGVFRGHQASVKSCAFSPDGRHILSESSDGTLRLWDIISYQHAQPPQRHTEAVLSTQFSPDGRLALTASEDTSLLLWDVSTRQPIRQFIGHNDIVNDCAFSPTGDTILSASSDRTVRLWDIASGQQIRVLRGHTAEALGCAFCPDGAHVLSFSRDRSVVLWDLATGTSTQSWQFSARSLTIHSFTRDGRYVLSASPQRTLAVWDVLRACEAPAYAGRIGPEPDLSQVQMRIAFPGRHMFQTCVNSDARLAATSIVGGGLTIVWEVATGREICHLENPSGLFINDAAFVDDGRLLTGTTGDRTLHVWQTSTGRELAHWPADFELECCAADHEGRHYTAGDKSGAVHFLALDGLVPDTRSEPVQAPSPPEPRPNRRRWQFWRR